jgi:uncharacterized membrane protein
MVKYPNAASGIKKVFLAKIIGVIGVPLAFIPGIGALLLMTCTVAATIFNVWGILEASKDHNGYQTALVFTVADLIFSIVDTFIDNTAISNVLSFAGNVMNIAVLYYICRRTAQGREELRACKQGRPCVECKQDLPYCHGSVPCCGIYPDTEHSRCNYITDSRCCDYLCVCGISDLSLSERTVSQP